MTQWVKDAEGGRARGPRAIARAWVEVMVRPRRFFRAAVAPGDQAPGLLFGMAVVLVEEAVRLALQPGGPPVYGGRPALSVVVVLGVAVLVVAPLALHLVAALQTVILVLFVRNRAGVSETVQVLAYAIAPCAFAGIPVPGVRIACALYGAALLAIGMSELHDTPLWKGVLVTLLPAVVVFGYGFRAFAAAATLWPAAFGEFVPRRPG